MQLYITFCVCAKKGLYERYKVCPAPFRRSSLDWLQTMESEMARLRARPKLVRWDSLASRKLPRSVTSCSHPYVMIPFAIGLRSEPPPVTTKSLKHGARGFIFLMFV